jgi:hypothetical protein
MVARILDIASSAVRPSKERPEEDSGAFLFLEVAALVRDAGVELGLGISASFFTSRMLSMSSKAMVADGFFDPVTGNICQYYIYSN